VIIDSSTHAHILSQNQPQQDTATQKYFLLPECPGHDYFYKAASTELLSNDTSPCLLPSKVIECPLYSPNKPPSLRDYALFEQWNSYFLLMQGPSNAPCDSLNFYRKITFAYTGSRTVRGNVRHAFRMTSLNCRRDSKGLTQA
jgi:hypothetical protein